jgi:hypothetical protein
MLAVQSINDRTAVQLRILCKFVNFRGVHIYIRETHRWTCLLNSKHRLPFIFADQAKQTYVFHFPFAANLRKLPFSVYIYWMLTYTYVYLYIYIYLYLYICVAISNRKRKPRRFSLIRLPFAHCANGSSSFVRLFMKKKPKLSFCKRNKRTCPCMRRLNVKRYIIKKILWQAICRRAENPLQITCRLHIS